MSSELEKNIQATMAKYGDIYEREHPTSPKHPRMSISDRAAQFSPFAALTGYDDAIAEEARLTDAFLEMDEGELSRLDEKLVYAEEKAAEHPLLQITCFVPDALKEGGAYLVTEGHLKRIDRVAKKLYFTDGKVVDLTLAVKLEGEIF